MIFGKTSSADFAVLLDLIALLFQEKSEARALLQQKHDKVFAPEYPKVSWCHLYELPAAQHFASGMVLFGQQDALRALTKSDNQLETLAKVVQEIQSDDSEPTDEEAEEMRPFLGQFFAWAESSVRSLRCLMIFGVYLNDLIALVREDGFHADKALLSALKIDPTVLGCPSVVARISKAVLLDDQSFLEKVRKAMGGKLTKREQKTYQDMRLVLQVLHEMGTDTLSTDDLYTLFYEELNLVRSEVGDGDVKSALRQFAYQFMKQKVVSQK